MKHRLQIAAAMRAAGFLLACASANAMRAQTTPLKAAEDSMKGVEPVRRQALLIGDTVGSRASRQLSSMKRCD
jgi:phage FluMu protein gp41